MAGSQLKRLKASLREQGVIGPQQSKKQRRKIAQNGKVNTNKRAAALESIREQFNPFDFKHNARGPKFQVTSNRPVVGDAAKGIAGRPGDAKALGEERRRQTLLVEMNRRNKTGVIRDQRFGENDASMSYEEKMAQRFVREKQNHKTSIFDLEDDDGMEGLTHMGKAISFPDKDDFEEPDLDGEDGDSNNESADSLRGIKRVRESDYAGAEDDENVEGEPERKKTKQEIYKEIIAKSKLHKAERQAQKDADEDLREELDQDLSDIHNLLFQKPKGQTNGDEVTPKPADTGRERLERDYDLRLKQLAMDRRAKPSDRTLTEEEIAQKDVEKLKELEEMRQRRMRGEELSDGEDEDKEDEMRENQPATKPGAFGEEEEDDDFKLGSGIRTRPTATELGFDDEDDFFVEDDLLASGSDLEPIESEDEDSSAAEEEEQDDDQDNEFVKGLLDETDELVFSKEMDTAKSDASEIDSCPETLEQFLDISRDLLPEKIPSTIQKVRILYHPSLASENKAKLATFSRVLVQYLYHLSNASSPPPFATLESIIRHIHSLAKSFSIDISEEFRSHINDSASRCLSPTLGDLVILVAIGTIFPPSDAFHPVITPAMLQIARYLGQKIPKSTTDFVKGIFMGTLALHYLKLSQRFCPEFMNFCLNTLTSLAPTAPAKKSGSFPQHEPAPGIRITGARENEVKGLKITDCATPPKSKEEDLAVRVATLSTTLQLLDTASQLYASKASFCETFSPVVLVLDHLMKGPCKAQLPLALSERIAKLQAKLQTTLTMAKLSRRPLELHHHRPLAIKTAIPKFEDQFDPNRHYDADKDRAELAKLKAEHKKERKGAMRELRKDANFVAREKLRVKKQKDAAYEKKYKRLVAEIQGEEGREANAYEREKQARKRASKK